MKKVISTLFVAVMALPNIGMTGSSPISGWEVAVGGGDIKDLSEMYGIDVGYYANQKFRFRLGHTLIDYENQRDLGAAKFTEKVEQSNTRLTVDWFPWARKNGLFISAGATQLSDPSSLDMQVDSGLIYSLNGNAYTAAQLGSITGSIETQSVVPYVGLGYRYQRRQDRGWFAQAEVGGIFGLSPELKLSSTNPSNIATLNTDLQIFADSKNSQLEDSYTMYGLTFGYLF